MNPLSRVFAQDCLIACVSIYLNKSFLLLFFKKDASFFASALP